MAKKEKKPLSTKQTQAKNRIYQILCYLGMGVGVITPAAIYGTVNYDEWFAQNPEGYKIGIGAGIAMAVTAFAIFLITYKKEKNLKMTDMWISLIVCVAAIGLALKLVGNIINEIGDIVLFTALGLCAAFGFDVASWKFQKEADAYRDARKKVKSESIEDKAKREVEEELKKQEERPID